MILALAGALRAPGCTFVAVIDRYAHLVPPSEHAAGMRVPLLSASSPRRPEAVKFDRIRWDLQRPVSVVSSGKVHSLFADSRPHGALSSFSDLHRTAKPRSSGCDAALPERRCFARACSPCLAASIPATNQEMAKQHTILSATTLANKPAIRHCRPTYL